MILFLSGIGPLILSFYPPLRFYQHKRALMLTLGLIVLIFGAWDVLATRRGHWYFNPEGIAGAWFLNLPVEEWLFFIVIPFCCLFTWEVVNFYKNKLK
ncbi:MAG TPA: lycopene cyclase domain-containing protein [Candidatus Omnitrophota bacterium]|nr:lycopene cyclase domain-containing protein [Candidatus Omnitrophota bacterium]HPN56253.1 lycopene cyclase domain-containing protein [Candidatus Omnitrophota bacterium]